MRLTVVGCAPSYTQRAGRASSCYLVEHSDTAIALDFGTGAFSWLSRYRAPESLDAIFISHIHADHNVDLVPLRHYLTYERADGRAPALYAPAELRERLAAYQPGAALDAFPRHDLAAGSWTVDGLTVEAGRVTHIPDSFAFRVSGAGEDGPGLVYSGDCGAADDLMPLIRQGDTLLCEAAFGVNRESPGLHLTAQEAGDVAQRGGAARLILTHVLDRNATDATLNAARAAFGGEAQLAEPGLTLDIR